MAQRGAPEPDPDRRDIGSIGPFLGAVAVIVILIVGVVLAQVLSPAGDVLDDDERINRAVADYVRAHNEDDTAVLDRLRCESLPAEEAPLAEVDGDVEFDGTGEVSIDGDRGTVEVRTVVDGTRGAETWQVTRVGDVWRICRF
ncbi:Rv0361 family membrane protein [Rhodococcus chondri]|uniref:Lumazine-binding protein n=1 Tax=Rhodococcus chondri TaxID=3065941 RepID=A0ABU7JXL2_9NOCA|nr:hypothetical protein [Rhodococcus sp. CC-R104]MEE2034760.1 hypothetical protein [Rhodococcus sp. CC-R104]